MQLQAECKKIDNLGRITIPSAFRKNLNLNIGDELDMCIDNDNIIIKKHIKSCVFCDNTESLTEFNTKMICSNCLNILKK